MRKPTTTIQPDFKIEDEARTTLESSEEIEVTFVNYFTNLFTVGLIGNMEECLQPIMTKVTATMNEELLQNFTNEEVSFALKQMALLKAPGPRWFTCWIFLEPLGDHGREDMSGGD